MLEDKLELLVE